MELLVRIAPVDARERGLRQIGLDGHDGLRAGVRGIGRIAQQRQHGRHVVEIFGANFLRFRVGIDVVVAVGQAEPAGGSERDDAAGIGVILSGPEPEKRIVARFQVNAREQWG